MSESAEDYKSRLASYVVGRDPVAVLTDTPRRIAEDIAGLASEQLSRKPAPDQWCINEIVGHLADDEIVTAWRYRQMIENNGALLAGFDQEEWVRLGNYHERPAGESLELFRQLRELNLRMLRSLTPEEWDREGVHAERGRMTVRDLAQQMAGHDVNHLLQIQRILDDQGRERPVPVTSP